MDQSIKNAMTKVYHKNLWKGDESKSGRGSSKVNTQHLEKEMPYIIDNLNIKSILDIPCGDFAWMPRLLANTNNSIAYHGSDIVPEIIENNQQFATDNISFSCLDITSDPLPDADLIFVRDCFNHLTNEMVFKGLNNIKNSNIKYIAVTHFNWRNTTNRDIELKDRVDWRKINFTIAPFFFDTPIDFIVEGSSEPLGKDKTIAIWQVDDLQILS